MCVSFFVQITSCAQGDGLHFDPASYSHASKFSEHHSGRKANNTQIAIVISKQLSIYLHSSHIF